MDTTEKIVVLLMLLIVVSAVAFVLKEDLSYIGQKTSKLFLRPTAGTTSSLDNRESGLFNKSFNRNGSIIAVVVDPVVIKEIRNRRME